MIVNYTASGWKVITQRAHGVLAAQFAFQWKAAQRPPRWVETLLAIAEHDDAEVELDGENLLTPQGGPLNYDMKKFDPDHCIKLSRFSITKSRYIALLTSMHMQFLYQSESKTSAQAKAFLAEQLKLQAEWRHELNISKNEADSTYSLLEWCDAFSLLLCKQEIQPEQRAVEVSKGPDGKEYQLYHLSANQLTLNPWPFETSAFTVYFESRMISQLQFDSSAAFRKAFNEAAVQETVWELVKSKVPRKVKKI